MPQMIFTAATRIEARALAAELRRIHAGTDYRVSIEAPLFAGDAYRVVVG